MERKESESPFIKVWVVKLWVIFLLFLLLVCFLFLLEHIVFLYRNVPHEVVL